MHRPGHQTNWPKQMPDLSIVPAGAGAGKTHHIQTTLAGWVRNKMVLPERIIAVTFTEAAAGELRHRIRTALIKDGELDAALAVERAYVSTIHGLGRRLLIEHAFATGASPQLRLIAEDEQDLLIRHAINENSRLKELTRNLGAYGYRSSFSSQDTQEDSFRGNLLRVIGLLRTLGPRGTDPAMVDFAEASVRAGYGKPQGESEALATGLSDAIGALLAQFPRSLEMLADKEAAKKEFRENFIALTQTAQMLAKGGTDWRLWQKVRKLRQSKKGSPTPDGYDALTNAVMAAADKLVHHPGPLEDAVSHARTLVEGAQFVMVDYEERKRQLGVIDFGDMVTNAARLVEENPAVLSSIMAEVDCVIVDEFQDTNPIQFSFLWNLARRAKHALIVGDTKQAIMGFQGADPRLTVALTKKFETSPLDLNWRSDPRIMDFVNALGPKLFEADYTKLTPQNKCGTDTALEVITLANKRSARKGGKPQHYIADRILSLLSEDIKITDRYTKQLRPLEPRDVAVLCPTNKQCQAYAAALRDLGLPVRVEENGWWASPVVQAATYALRYAVNPLDRHAALCFAALGPSAVPLDVALKSLVQHGRPEIPELAELDQLWPTSLAMPVVKLLHDVIHATRLRDWCDHLPDPAQARADLLRLEAEATAFTETNRDMREASGFYGQGANVFLGWLEDKISQGYEDKQPNPAGSEADGVELVTWHASKGREWSVVIVCGLDIDRNPRPGQFYTVFPNFDDLEHVIDDAELAYTPSFAAPEATERFLDLLRPEAEETCRRLLYVALTRARDRLVIEWPQPDGKDDDKPAITARRLMTDLCGLKIDGNGIMIGDVVFSARQTICSQDVPASFDGPVDRPFDEDNRIPRFALVAGSAAERIEVIGPSKATSTTRALPSQIATRQIAPGMRIDSIELTQATDKGTAIHEAFRTLLQRPDLIGRVGAHCRLDAEDVEALAAQAASLREALSDLGYHKLHVEQPLEIRLADGGSQLAIIDLLAESDDGYVIVDHKSGAVEDHAVRFASYWPQLAAYVDAVEALGDKPVKTVAIFWTDNGELTLAS